MHPKICVIGGGISGLTTGYHLMKAGFNPTVFEKKLDVGGRMSSEKAFGFTIDKGAYTIPEFHKNTLGLIRELGIGDSLKETVGTSSTFRSGKEYPIKIGSPLDFLKYKLLSMRDKKEMIRLFLYAISLGKSLNLNNPTEKTFELEKESAAEYLLRENNEEILECVAYPIFCEIFLGNPEGNSKAAFLATIRNLTRFKIYSLDLGLGMLPEALMKKVEVHLGAPVVKVHPMGKQGPYRVDVGSHPSNSFVFDTIVFAIPIPLVLEIFENFPAFLKERLQEVQYVPSIVAALAIDQPFLSNSLINNLLRKDFQTLGTIVSDHHKGPGRVPAGKGLVTVILCEEGSRNLFDQPDEMIKKEILKEMNVLYPGFSKRVIFGKIYRWRYGALQLRPGVLHQHSLVQRVLKKDFKNLFFVSDSMNRSSIEVQINAAIQAANRILNKYKT